MRSYQYVWELRRGGSVVATGLVSFDHEVEIGERLEIGSRPGIVRDILPTVERGGRRLIVEQLRSGEDP